MSVKRLSSDDPGHEEAGWFRMHVRANNVTRMREMLEQSPWLANAQGGWPLIEAASRGHLEAVDLLLRSGAKPDAPSPVAETWRPIMIAYAYPDVQHRLLDAGVAPVSDAEQETIEQWILSLHGNDEGETAILQALFRRDAEAVRSLLDESPELVNMEEGDHSLLHTAALLGYLEIVKLLVERGADLRAEDMAADTPADIAWINGQPDIVAYLGEASRRGAPGTES